MKKTIFIFLAIFLSSCSYINKQMGLKDDHIGEEILEQVIENQTGIRNLDFSPSTPEK